MLFSYQPYAIFMRKKSNILKNDNNTDDYNNLYAHLTWITDKTGARAKAPRAKAPRFLQLGQKPRDTLTSTFS